MSYHITYSGGSGRTSGTPPGMPTLLTMSLQGVDAPFGVPLSPAQPPVPQDPNRTDLTWIAPAITSFAIDHYEIWRNGSLYGTTPDSTPAYSDTGATNCVNGTAGSGPQFYPGTTYTYQVRAVDIQGNKGPLSGTQRFVVYQNGTYNWGGDFTQTNTTVNYSDTTGAPQGGVGDIKFAFTAAFGLWLPFAGGKTAQWNMWAGAFNYLQLDLKPTVTGQVWTMGALRVGDITIKNSGGNQLVITLNNYNTPSNGIWTTYKIPLVDLLTDFTNGYQPAVYKWYLQDQTGAAVGSWFVDNVIYLP